MLCKYSIIIPHKNIPNLLNRCLSSIPQKDEIQVIVVDDASDDIETVRKIVYNRCNIDFVEIQNSKGAGHARNEGLKMAKGKWLLFADADDFFTMSLLENLERHYEDDVDIIYFGVDCVDCDSLALSSRLDRRKKTIDNYKNYPAQLERICKSVYIQPWGKMIKAELIRQYRIQFDETPVANDYYFSVVSSHFARKTSFDQTPIYVYTIRNGSLSNVFCPNPQVLKTRLEVYKRVQDFYDSHMINRYPFYLLSVSIFFKSSNYASLIKKVWKKYDMSLPHVFYYYLKGKFYQFIFGLLA